MFRIRNFIVACLLPFAVVSPFAIESARAAQASPIITSASATATQLTINGNNFLPGTASVLLGTFGPLAVVTQTGTQLVVNLPPNVPPGSYVLSVEITDKGKGETDESVVTIGAPASLAGIPCDAGPDKPNARTTVTVDQATGIITLRCESTNPVLTVQLGPGPLSCTTFPVPFCFFPRYSVQEVDAAGTPVANGFACLAPAPNQSPFPALCAETQRFPAGGTVRLAAANTYAGLAPSWSGCDSVAAGICTLTMTAAPRLVTVTPVVTP